MGIKRKTQSVKVLLSEFELNSSAIPVTELIKRFYLQINLSFKSYGYREVKKLLQITHKS